MFSPPLPPRPASLLLLALLLSWGPARGQTPGAGYSEDPAVISRGTQLFELYCASCHGFDRDMIGPGLGYITAQAGKDWIAEFIRDPHGLLARGDRRAGELATRFNYVMPPLPLPAADMEALLASIHRNRRVVNRRNPPPSAPGWIEDPFPEKIAPSGLALVLQPVAVVPASADTPPRARINKLAGVIDGPRHRLFVNDQRGTLHEIGPAGARPFFDLAAVSPRFTATPGLATGFTSFAFSPSFAEDGLLYTNHAENPGEVAADFLLPPGVRIRLQYVITEWRTNADRSAVRGESRRELLRIDMYETAHCAQELAFNPRARPGDADHGLLYLGVGDGAASYAGRTDLFAAPDLVWGKILRIDPRGRDGRNGRYGIPSGNPAARSPGLLPEILASGFRNPNAFSWDEAGTLFASDIGHWQIEEINRIRPGADYGWPAWEGRFATNLTGNQRHIYPRSTPPEKSIDPLIALDHDEMAAVAGGYEYNGTEIPALRGHYLFGDIASGRVYVADAAGMRTADTVVPRSVALRHDGRVVTLSELVGEVRSDLRLGQDARGEMYLLSKSNGAIWKIIGVAPHVNPG